LTAPVLAIIVGLAVLVPTVIVLAFTRDDGAATSAEAAQQMIAAIEANDGLAVLEQLPPGERRALSAGAAQLGTELQKVGLLTTSDLGHLDGPVLQTDDLRISTTELSKDMDAVDLVGGTVTVHVPPGDGPLTDHARQLLQDDAKLTLDPNGQTASRDLAKDPIRLIAIREGGGWHVSLAYSVADALRSASGESFPKMGQGPPAIGADSADAAVHDLAKAYADADVERLVTLMYPDEARSLYDYAPVFLPRAKDLAKRAAEQGTYDVQLNSLTTDVSGSGTERQVRVTGFDIDIRDELQKTHLTYDGRCLHLDHRINDRDKPFASSSRCDGDTATPDDATDDSVAQLAIFGGGADLPTFTVVERNGRWFISPAKTFLASAAATLEGADAAGVDAFASRLAASWNAGIGNGVSGVPLDPPPTPPGQDPPSTAEYAAAKARLLAEGCARLTTGPDAAAVTAACRQRLIDTKRVDPADLPSS
jgi:hypothetical protein